MKLKLDLKGCYEHKNRNSPRNDPISGSNNTSWWQVVASHYIY